MVGRRFAALAPSGLLSYLQHPLERAVHVVRATCHFAYHALLQVNTQHAFEAALPCAPPFVHI